MAADQGHAKAKSALAVYYEVGLGVQRDIDKAFRLVEEAASLGEHTAQLRLGRFYLDGEAVDSNVTAAYLWVYIAERNGNQKAEELLETTSWNLSNSTIVSLKQVGRRCIESEYQRCNVNLDQQ
jgi:TPR repeat protein